MNKIKFGSFVSENRINKYLSVVIERPNYNVTIKTGAVIYPYSVHFSDVTEHNHVIEGDKCQFSPTGFCSQHDVVRWDSMNFPASPRIVASILIERIEKATNLLEEEKEEIYKSLENEQTFTENE